MILLKKAKKLAIEELKNVMIRVIIFRHLQFIQNLIIVPVFI